ncbi:MAG TPA: type VI secretion system baseplate subunit TssG [Steroidobacteraceae bacterium]|nr:type VI secretion system baseplate subunit TssG [Steroidobacteraceae bacterium]
MSSDGTLAVDELTRQTEPEAPDAGTLDVLRDRPERFTLFAALRRIEQVHRERPRLGESRKAADDPVRIAQRPHLYFAPSEVAAFGPEDDGVPRLEQHSFGVFGPNGALPLHLTELAYARRHQADDPTLVDFINTFQHRLTSLFYRAWADADPCASLDRPVGDRFRLYAGALLGIGAPTARDRDAVLDYAKLSRAGLLAPQSRPAESLERLIADYFGLEVELVQFVGEWLPIPADARLRLGVPQEGGALGIGATLGGMTWQCQTRFEIALGPLPVAEFVNFLPGARGLQQLRALVRLYTNGEWSWQLRLLIEPAAVPPLRLGDSGWLGWTSWLGERTTTARDALIEGSEPAAAGHDW